MLGGVSASIKLEAKLQTTYDLTFNGGFTFSSSGATGNGVNGYASTQFDNTSLPLNDYALGFYQNTSNAPAKTEEILMGASSSTRLPAVQIGTNFNSTDYFIRSGAFVIGQTANSGNITGFYVLNRQVSGTSECYRNGNITPIISVSNSYSNTGSAVPILLWNFWRVNEPYSNGFANQRLSFAFISESFSLDEAGFFEDIINTFQTSIGRNTY